MPRPYHGLCSCASRPDFLLKHNKQHVHTFATLLHGQHHSSRDSLNTLQTVNSLTYPSSHVLQSRVLWCPVTSAPGMLGLEAWSWFWGQFAAVSVWISVSSTLVWSWPLSRWPSWLRLRQRPNHLQRPRTSLFVHYKCKASVESTWTTAQSTGILR